MSKSFYDLVFDVVKQIPKGKVMSYGSVAAAVEHPRASRIVGGILHRNKHPVVVPCHRVVYKDGRLTDGYAFGGLGVQEQLLRDEGVVFLDDGRVDMEKCRYIYSS